MAFEYEKMKIGDAEGWEITSYTGTAKRVVVPEEIDGMPVLSIGKSAFYRQEDMRELVFPAGLRMLRPFAISHCRSLNKIVLADGITEYYDSAIRTCTGLSEIEISMNACRFEAIRNILDDSDRKLNMMLHFPDYEQGLTFPAYISDTVEDTRASTFHVKIVGSGFAFRECVRRDGLRLKEYDALFRRAASDDVDTAIQISVDRLRYPVELSERAQEIYSSYLKMEMDRALDLAIESGNADWIGLFVENKLIEEDKMDHALRLVSEKRLTELAGMLMDYRLMNQGPKTRTVLSLDDFDFDL